MNPVTAAHPGIVDVNVPKSTSLEPRVAGEIAEIAIRFGSQRWAMVPPLVTGLGALVLAIVPLAAGQASEPELRRLIGSLLGPVVLAVMASIGFALVVGWMHKVKAELALHALDVDPVLRKRAYRVALAARRSPRAWLLKSEELRTRVALRVTDDFHSE